MNVKKVTCYGGGVIGLGWAANFLMAGYETTVYLRKQEKLAPAKAEIAAFLDFLAKEQVFPAEQSAAYLTKVYQGTDSNALRKGAGHFESTSIWDGNVAFAGRAARHEAEGGCQKD